MANTQTIDRLVECASALGDVDPDRTLATDEEATWAVLEELGEGGLEVDDHLLSLALTAADQVGRAYRGQQ